MENLFTQDDVNEPPCLVFSQDERSPPPGICLLIDIYCFILASTHADCDPYLVYEVQPWSLKHVRCLLSFHGEKLNYTELNLWWLACYWFLENVFAGLTLSKESTELKYIIYTMPIQLLAIDRSLNLTFRLHQAHYKVITLLSVNRAGLHC